MLRIIFVLCGLALFIFLLTLIIIFLIEVPNRLQDISMSLKKISENMEKNENNT